MVEWEYAILLALDKLEGTAYLVEIYRWLKDNEPLSGEHLHAQWDQRPAFQHQARSHISNLCQKGEVERLSRGRYAITQAGRARIG